MAQGWHSTPWSSRALAWAVVADGSVSAISPRTLRQLGREVDLRPPRTRSWQTARVDDHFRVCAEPVRWCDAKAVGWAHTGRWVVCVDARPKGPMLDRTPLRRAIPGASAQQACADVRQGTVNGRVVWIVHTGRLEAVGVAQKRCRALHPSPEAVATAPPVAAGGVPHPGWRSQPYRRAPPRVLPTVPLVVAAPLHTRAGLLAAPRGVVEPCVQ